MANQKRVRQRPAKLASIAAVSEGLDISPSKVRTMIADGELPIVRFGKSVRIPWEAVDKLIADRLATATTGEGAAHD